MNALLAVMVVTAFGFGVGRFGLLERTREVNRNLTSCLRIVRDRKLSDYQKQVSLQRHARSLLRLAATIVGSALLALGIPLGLVWALDSAGVGSLAGTVAVLERVDFLAAVTVAGIIVVLLPRLRRL